MSSSVCATTMNVDINSPFAVESAIVGALKYSSGENTMLSAVPTDAQYSVLIGSSVSI